MEEARSRVELAIISDHQAHAATCVASEGNRQNDVAQAILAGGGSATVAAVIRHVSGVACYARRQLGLLECILRGTIPRLAFEVQSKMDWKIFDSEGHYVADIQASKIYDRSGKRTYDLRG